jgi:hypothetical protein
VTQQLGPDIDAGFEPVPFIEYHQVLKILKQVRSAQGTWQYSQRMFAMICNQRAKTE